MVPFVGFWAEELTGGSSEPVLLKVLNHRAAALHGGRYRTKEQLFRSPV